MRVLKLIVIGALLLAIPATAEAAQSHRLSRPLTTEMVKSEVAVIGSYAFEAFSSKAESKVTYIVQIDLRTHVASKIETISSGTLEAHGASSGRLALLTKDVQPSGETKITLYTLAPDGTDRRVIASSSYVGDRSCGNEIEMFRPLEAGRIAVQSRSFGARTPNGDSCLPADAGATPEAANVVEIRDQFGILQDSKPMPAGFDLYNVSVDPTAHFFASFGKSDWRITPFLGDAHKVYRRNTKLDYTLSTGPNQAMWMFTNGGGRYSGVLRFYPNPQKNQRSLLIARGLRNKAAVGFCGKDLWFVSQNSRNIMKYSPRSGNISTVVKTSLRVSGFRCSSSSAVLWETESGGNSSGRAFAVTPRT